MRNLVTPVKVGLLVVIGVVAFFVFFSVIRNPTAGGESKEYWALFGDASGLAPDSEVRIAGVVVGRVTRIELANRKARVYFTVPANIPVYPNAVVTKRSSSILGDSLIELDPGSPQPGASLRPGGGRYPHSSARAIPAASNQDTANQPLEPGSEIPTVREPMSTDQLFQTLGEVAGDIQALTRSVREIVEGERGTIQEIVRNLAHASETLDSTLSRSSRQLDRVLSNAEAITAEVRSLTAEHSDDVSEIIVNVRDLSEQAKEVVATIHGIVGANEEEWKEGAEGIRGSLENLNKTLANLESITSKIDRGEGAVGKLVSDKELGERVSSVIETSTDYMQRIAALRVELLLRSEYLFRAEGAKTYVGIKVVPSPDKYFLFEVVDDPLGFVSRETFIRTPPGQEEAANQEVRKTTDILKFTAEVGKRVSFTTFRFGLIESTGGAGLDLHFLDDRLTFSLDLFSFANPETAYPRLRAYADFRFLNYLFITAGVDDVLNSAAFETLTGRLRAGRDSFVGGGIILTDDDMKLIFGAGAGLLP